MSCPTLSGVSPAVFLVAMGLLNGACGATSDVRVDDDPAEHRARIYESYTLSELANQRGDIEAAIIHAHNAVEFEPTDCQLRLQLSEYLHRAMRYQEAIDAVSEGLDLCADPMGLYLELAISQEAAGDLSGAEGSLVRATEIAPDRLSPFVALAQFTARQAADLDAAVLILVDYAGRHPEDAQAWRYLGAFHQAGGNGEDALAAYRNAREVEPENEQTYVQLIAIARDLGRYPDAEQWAQECASRFRQGVACRIEHIRTLERSIPDPLARHNRTFSVLQVLSRAIGANVVRLREVELELAHQLDAQRAFLFLASIAVDRQRNSRIQSMAAWAAYRIDEDYLAIKYMRRVLDIRPRSAEALNFIGYTYAERGERLDEAEALIRAALDIWPNDGNIQDSLGWVFYQRGLYVDAVKWLYAAVLKVPDVAEIAEHLGDAWLALGDLEQAREMYMRAVDLADEELRDHLRKKIDALDPAPST